MLLHEPIKQVLIDSNNYYCTGDNRANSLEKQTLSSSIVELAKQIDSIITLQLTDARHVDLHSALVNQQLEDLCSGEDGKMLGFLDNRLSQIVNILDRFLRTDLLNNSSGACANYTYLATKDINPLLADLTRFILIDPSLDLYHSSESTVADEFDDEFADEFDDDYALDYGAWGAASQEDLVVGNDTQGSGIDDLTIENFIESLGGLGQESIIYRLTALNKIVLNSEFNDELQAEALEEVEDLLGIIANQARGLVSPGFAYPLLDLLRYELARLDEHGELKHDEVEIAEAGIAEDANYALLARTLDSLAKIENIELDDNLSTRLIEFTNDFEYPPELGHLAYAVLANSKSSSEAHLNAMFNCLEAEADPYLKSLVTKFLCNSSLDTDVYINKAIKLLRQEDTRLYAWAILKSLIVQGEAEQVLAAMWKDLDEVYSGHDSEPSGFDIYYYLELMAPIESNASTALNFKSNHTNKFTDASSRLVDAFIRRVQGESFEHNYGTTELLDQREAIIAEPETAKLIDYLDEGNYADLELRRRLDQELDDNVFLEYLKSKTGGQFGIEPALDYICSRIKTQEERLQSIAEISEFNRVADLDNLIPSSEINNLEQVSTYISTLAFAPIEDSRISRSVAMLVNFLNSSYAGLGTNSKQAQSPAPILDMNQHRSIEMIEELITYNFSFDNKIALNTLYRNGFLSAAENRPDIQTQLESISDRILRSMFYIPSSISIV
ncbi:MAG: hypothetical protein O2962_01540 [Cyanobacteria bacterium]|nr:hypothetical protein [Cyanobacteriota bacterium]